MSFGLIDAPVLVIKPSTTYNGAFDVVIEFPPLTTIVGDVPGA